MEGYKNESPELFTEYRRLILAELERLDKTAKENHANLEAKHEAILKEIRSLRDENIELKVKMKINIAFYSILASTITGAIVGFILKQLGGS